MFYSLVAWHLQLTHPTERTERGATAVEYGIMVALIALVIIGAVTSVGTRLSTLFGSTSTKI